MSTYKDHQTITLQELPEKAPTGQLPRAVEAITEFDLVDQCKPGDRVQVVASYRYYLICYVLNGETIQGLGFI